MTASTRLGLLGAAMCALAALLVLPGLGGYGLWEPAERQVAERARAAAGTSASLPLYASARAPALGLRLFGQSEGAARLPGGLVALANLAALAWAGARLFGRRAGLFAALALAGLPLFVLEARQLTSDLTVTLGVTLALGALSALVRRGRVEGVALALGAAGLALASIEGGLLVGALPILLALAGAAATTENVPHRRPLLFGAGAGAALIAVALIVVRHAAGTPSWLLGAEARTGPNLPFDTLLERLGFGLFPLAGLALFALFAPVFGPRPDEPTAGPTAEEPAAVEPAAVEPAVVEPAVLEPAAVDGDERATFFGRVLLLHAAFALGLGTLQLQLAGAARLLLLPAVALAIGVLLDRRLSGSVRPNLLLALLSAGAALLLVRDVTLTPEALVSAHLPTRITWPAELEVRTLVRGVGGLTAVGLFLLFGVRVAESAGGAETPAPPTGRWGTLGQRARQLAPVLVLAPPLVFSFALAHHLVPTLARHLSSKALVDSFRVLAPAGATLGLYRIGEAEAGLFAQPPLRQLDSAAALGAHLRAEPGALALVPRTELAALDAALGEARVPYAVADASSSRTVLITGRLPAGKSDGNPLRALVAHVGMTGPDWAQPFVGGGTTAAIATFGGAVDLIHAELPATASRGRSFPLTLIFRVRGPIAAEHKIFVHAERGGQPIVPGDHAPLGGIFATQHWRAGDLLRDRYDVDLPRMTAGAGSYRVSIGFWPGGDTPERLPITAGRNDGSNRVLIGTIEVD